MGHMKLLREALLLGREEVERGIYCIFEGCCGFGVLEVLKSLKFKHKISMAIILKQFGVTFQT